jgi:hypothetical protein
MFSFLYLLIFTFEYYLVIINYVLYTRAVRKVTSGKLLTKQAMRKRNDKLLLNIVIAGTETFIIT